MAAGPMIEERINQLYDALPRVHVDWDSLSFASLSWHFPNTVFHNLFSQSMGLQNEKQEQKSEAALFLQSLVLLPSPNNSLRMVSLCFGDYLFPLSRCCLRRWGDWGEYVKCIAL